MGLFGRKKKDGDAIEPDEAAAPAIPPQIEPSVSEMTVGIDGADEEDFDAERRSGSALGVWMALALAVMTVGAAAGGWYFLGDQLMGGNTPQRLVPIISADNEAVKRRPADPGGQTVPHQDKLVYDRVDGRETAERPEQLLPPPEQPNDPFAALRSRSEAAAANDPETRAAQMDRPSSATITDPLAGAVTAGTAQSPPTVARLSPPTGPGAGDPSSSAASVNGATAGSNSLVSALSKMANAKRETGAEPMADAASSSSAAAQPAQTAPATRMADRPGSSAPRAASSPGPGAGQPAAQATRTAGVQSAPDAGQGNAATAATAERSPRTSSVSQPVTGPWMVQLASVRNPETANSEYQRLARAHNGILGDVPHQIVRADLGEKGIYYRIRVGGYREKGTAEELCDALKAQNAGCLVVRQ